MKNIVVFTGAGISAESGLGTFRNSGGLWEKFKISDVATPEAFQKNPSLVLSFYNSRRRQLLDARPNNAHIALNRLQEKYNLNIITQNIDNLHQQAGSKKLIHMHGSLDKAYCMNCLDKINLDFDLSINYQCKKCKKKGDVRIDVVWFGEQPKYLDLIYEHLEKTDIFLSIGTSNNVYPAAGFIDFVCNQQKRVELIEFNIEDIVRSGLCKEYLLAKTELNL